MTREKMTEMLSETICVPTADARAALEAREWNLLDAARSLQQARAQARMAEAAQARRRARGWSFRDLITTVSAVF